MSDRRGSKRFSFSRVHKELRNSPKVSFCSIASCTTSIVKRDFAVFRVVRRLLEALKATQLCTYSSFALFILFDVRF
jgi:hypothetical protein